MGAENGGSYKMNKMAELPKDNLLAISVFFLEVKKGELKWTYIKQLSGPARQVFATVDVRSTMKNLTMKEVIFMKVRELMNKEIVSILPTATLHDAALKMREQNIGSVLICEDGWNLRGIVTDRDISLAVAADFKDPKTTFASDVMRKNPVTIESSSDIDYALKLMNKSVIRRLPVTENKKVVGILSTSDVATEIKEELNQFMGLEEAFAKTTNNEEKEGGSANII
jgi:CBS domain-containing protein